MKEIKIKLPENVYDDLILVQRASKVSKQKICRMLLEGEIPRLLKHIEKKSYGE